MSTLLFPSQEISYYSPPYQSLIIPVPINLLLFPFPISPLLFSSLLIPYYSIPYKSFIIPFPVNPLLFPSLLILCYSRPYKSTIFSPFLLIPYYFLPYQSIVYHDLPNQCLPYRKSFSNLQWSIKGMWSAINNPVLSRLWPWEYSIHDWWISRVSAILIHRTLMCDIEIIKDT